MATKNDCLLSKDKQKYVVNSISDNGDNDGQYSNLNLNQNHKCHIPVHSCSYKTTKDKYYDSTVSENNKGKGTLKAWDKSPDLCLNTLKLNSDIKEKAEKQWKKANSFSNESKSTLSLHIFAFENSTAASFDFNAIKCESKNEIFTSSAFIIQNPFEFPRHKNDKVTEPEVSHFRTCQQLLNPNKVLMNGHKNVPASQQQQQQQFPPQILQHQPIYPLSGMQRFPLQNVQEVNPVSQCKASQQLINAMPARAREKRLIIIDGFNVMRGYQNLINGFQYTHDSRMNAVVLLPMIKSLARGGFTVRVALRRLPKPFEIFHMYVLDVLNKLQLIIYPEKDSLEADDKIMLAIAERYGAVIISNDGFNNHEEFEAVATNNTIKFRKQRNPNFSLEELQKRLIFENKLIIHAGEEVIYCYSDNADYKKVKDSQNFFWPVKMLDMNILSSLWNYVHCGICTQMGFKIPRNFIFMNIDESCPPSFDEFCARNSLYY